MTVSEQFNFINAYHEGTPVYYRNKMFDDEYKWDKVTEDHVFDFNSNVYSIGEPKSFEDCIAENESNIAFRMAVEHLCKADMCFRLRVTDNDDLGRETARYDVVRFSDLYRLWNIAIQYGYKHSGDLKPVTKEEGHYDAY